MASIALYFVLMIQKKIMTDPTRIIMNVKGFVKCKQASYNMHQKMLQGMKFGSSPSWYTIIILLLKKYKPATFYGA